MVTVDTNRGNGIISFFGLSTDTKPTSYNGENVKQGSSFFEIDTSSVYMFDGLSGTWTKL